MLSNNNNFIIEPKIIKIETLKVNALSFYPKKPIGKIAIFTHGYTSHKASLLNWCTALLDKGIPSIVFDLPGHFLGGQNSLEKFADFEEYTHLLFQKAADTCLRENHLTSENIDCFFGGHSLGAYFALEALTELAFNFKSVSGICVGLGIYPEAKQHPYTTKFFEKTIQIRNGYVHKLLNSEKMFAWIADKKKNLSVQSKRIHLICGDDDLIVGKNGQETLEIKLKDLGNLVTSDKPARLAHHLPEKAAKLVSEFICSEL